MNRVDRSGVRRKAHAGAGVEALLNPRNVVIAGASEKPGNWAERVWRNLRRYGYKGSVYPMNPKRDTIWETRCYTDFESLPEPPDHLVLLVPAPVVPDLLLSGARAGARSATVMTAGFAESTDETGRALARRLRMIIEETGLAVSGPNCLGNISARASMVTMPDDRPQTLVDGPVAIIAQSGGLAMAIKRTLDERGIGVGSVITSGNEDGLTTADYVAFFAADPITRVIVSYLEAVPDRERFLAACRSARDAGKPVVVVKLGASEVGREAAAGHTGALAGSMEAFDAVAGEAGVIRVSGLDDIVEVVEYMVHVPLPRGPRLGAITFSGALRGLLLDAAAAHNLKFSELSASSRRRLESLLTVGTIIGNPLDSGFAALISEDAYIRCVEILLEDPGIDILLLQEELPRAPGTERKERNLHNVERLAVRSEKPIVYVTMISHGLTDYSRALRVELPHLAFQQEVDKTMRALRAVSDYVARARLPPVPEPQPVSSKRLNRFRSEARGRVSLSEADSKALLSEFGLRATKERIAVSGEDAVKVAEQIGYPVVLKAAGPDIAHKTEFGGVILGVGTAEAVRQAYADIMRRVSKAGQAKPDGVLVAEQVTGGVELSLGLAVDREMGPVVMFGSGGIAVELYRDVAFASVPLDEARAAALISRTRISKLIAGYRGGPPLDHAAAVRALMALSNLALSAGDAIKEVDINPFILLREGGVVLDALVVMAGTEANHDRD
jgi:acetate---CoA ligase (ADP-forming)